MLDELLTHFHFLRPQWLLLVIPALLLVLWLRKIRLFQSGWQGFIAPHLYHHLRHGNEVKQSRPPYWLISTALFLSIIALAGPSWQKLPQPVYQTKEGHVLVLDMSLSMRATDVTPNRLTRAKYKAIDLIDTINEGEMGLVAYAGDAFTISPLTTDAANITALIPSLRPEIMPVAGSDPLLGLQMAAALLTNAGYQKGNLYWFTDGIELSQSAELREYAANLPFTLNILAIGTQEGAPIQQLNGELLKRNNGAIVVPKMYPERLQPLAFAAQGNFTLMTTDNRDIDALISAQRLLDKTPEEQQSTAGDQWAEAGPYLLLLCIPLFAYCFRRGLFFAVALIIVLPSAPQPAYAQTAAVQQAQSSDKMQSPDQSESRLANTNTSPWWKKPFLNANQQGLEQYNNGAYDNAATTFTDPLWQGSAQYKAGDYEGALKSFEAIDSVDSLYNQGNTLAQLGRLDDAISAYDKVLAAQPDHADAKANKALLEQMQKQQEQQQNQQNQEQNGDQQNQSQDQQQNQSDDDQSQQQDSQQNQNDGQQQAQNQNDEQQQNNEQNKPQQPEQDEQEQEDAEREAEQERNQNQDEQEPDDAQNAQLQQQEMTPEQKEQRQRLDNLMKKIPDDPAFLLQRKMQLEAQQRRLRSTPPTDGGW